ncbi:MAG TPA: helix-turn-helix domain-containing protein [Chloroflexota bacterium]|nr:helix-turn-helix domain-containing protein [Chloroflexota bacterium]
MERSATGVGRSAGVTHERGGVMALRAGDVAAPDAVTVAEVRRVILQGSRLAGGSAGLGNRVTWATSLRSRPPAYEPRGGGELVLAAQAALEGLRQVDAALTLERILEGLAQTGAAALAVSGPVTARARAAANEHAIPLIELPASTSLIDAERGVIGLVLDRHNELQSRASELYRRLAQLAVEGRGVEAIVVEAARATHRLVTFEDAGFRLRCHAAAPGESAALPDDAGLSSVEERARLSELVRAQPINPTTPAAHRLPAARLGLERWTAPIYTRERLRGFVSICGTAEALTEFDQLAASRAAAICALELAKEEAVLAAEQRAQRDVVDELLTSASTSGADREGLNRRAAQAGFSTTGPFGVCILAVGDEREPGPPPADAVARFIARGAVPALLRLDGGELTLVCDLGGPPEDGDARLRAWCGALVEAAATDGSGALALTAGVSRAHAGLAALPAAANEAREALRIGRSVYGAGRIVSYGDLGLYRVLHSLRDTPELRSFYEQTLGALVEYDRRTGQDYVETIETYFACHGNLSQTAQRLHHHRNSLLYRIGRIQEITGLDLEDPEARLSLQVALKARRLLH